MNELGTRDKEEDYELRFAKDSVHSISLLIPVIASLDLVTAPV